MSSVTLSVYAQEFRYYDQGAVSYEDFKAEILDIEDGIGEIYFDYRSQPKTNKIENSNMSYYRLEVGINTEQSWLDISRASKVTLDYFQVLFSIEYLYAERYNEAYVNTWTSDIRLDMEKLKSDKSIELSKFKKESQNGLREEIIEKWKNRLSDQIDNLDQDLPDLRIISTGGLDLHIGYGYNLKNGTIEQAFGNSHGMGFGLNFYYRNHAFIFSGAFGFNKLDNTLVQRPFWEDDITVNSVLFNLAYGRRFELGRMSVTPFVGPSLHDVYINRNEYEGVYTEIRNTSWNVGAGALIDIPFFSKVTSHFNYHTRWNGIGEQGVRLGIHYIAPVDHFDGLYEGSIVSLSINYYLRWGTVRFEKK